MKPIGLYLLIPAVLAAMLVVCGQPASAVGSISGNSCTPAEGTANSVFRFRIAYSDQPTGYLPQYPDVLELHIAGTICTLPLGDPRFQNGYDLYNGVEFYLYASGGLDQRNQRVGGAVGAPAGYNAFFLPDYRTFYVPGLKAKGNGDPNPDLTYSWYMHYTDPLTGTETERTVPAGGAKAPTIFDTTELAIPTVNAYNGQAMGVDSLYSFPMGWPHYHYVDPLDATNRTFPSSEDPPQFPDEGSSTSTYTFQVTYDNRVNHPYQPPRAWMLHGSDLWNNWRDLESGVMLYIRNLDYLNLPTESERQYWKYFHGHHMFKTDYNAGSVPMDFILRVGPTGSGLLGTGGHWMSTWATTFTTNRYYEALPPGRYEYYFACSDDDFSAWDIDGLKNSVWPQLEETPPMPTPPAPNDRFIDYTNGINYKRAIADDSPRSATTWAASRAYNYGDFVVPTVASGRKYVCYSPGTSGGSQPGWPTTFGSYVSDGSVLWVCAGAERPGSYVDKKTYMPGAWTWGYPYDSWVGQSFRPSVTRWMDGITVQYQAFTFPIVDPGLFQISTLEGFGRFMGTLSPYKRAVNPVVPFQDSSSDYRHWAETSGGTDHDVYTFKVNYWHSAGIAPSYVALYLKNGWNGDDGQPYRYYVMLPTIENPTIAQYKAGVTYQCQLTLQQLGRGSHCYYFEAADAQWTDVRYGRSAIVDAHVCRYPRRPDTTEYRGDHFYDHELPNNWEDHSQNLPIDNDFINGPWVNTKPELVDNSWSVTPSSGPSGTNFRFLITYKDADNQRPFRSDIIIQTDDAGTTWRGSMFRAMPSAGDPSVPADNLTRAYTDGVVYEWNTSSAPGLRLQVGLRYFRFEFTDNWGSPIETDDNVAGETVYAPQNGTSWAGSFILTGNTAPRLTNGEVKSADGTSNEVTTWNYKVTYSDADNQAPQYILVFLGRQTSPPSGPIVWDSAHAMEQVNVQDIVYNHGVQFFYSTRLSGNSTTPIKYYHCFVASDGVDTADYDATNSPSSGMIWKTAQALTATGNPQIFNFAHHPLVTDVPPGSILNPTNYMNPLIYNGTTLLNSSQYALAGVTGSVTLAVAPSPPVTSKYWFGTEPDSSGPVAVGGNNAPELSNGQVAPAVGHSTTLFTYSVTYKDLDGQAPQFVHVVVDANMHMMTNTTGSTTYREGVAYSYSTTLTSGNHSFYFEASDGSALTIFEADPSTVQIDPIEGPYVNDHPIFLAAAITPSGSVTTTQAITYSIEYRDLDNEGPKDGWPIVYVDNPNEQDWNGTAGAVGNDFIKSSNPLENWTDNQFAGMPVQVILAGTSQRIVYKILSNTKDTLKLVASDVSSVVTAGSEFNIGRLLMVKQDPTDQIYSDAGGVIYEAKVPSLGTGTHMAHFKAITTEVTMPGQTADYTLRYPATDDMVGPIVNRQAPPGNVAPTLTNGGSTPQTGTASTPFRFAVTYTDANGDPPTQQFEGYINLVIEETPGVFTTYPMSPTDPAPQFSLGAEYAYTLSLTTAGAHQFYFEASDGWFAVRLPSSGYYTAYISRPPILSEGLVTPFSGNRGRVYEYKVKYTDPDNNPPASIKLYIDGDAPIEISVPMPGANYANGVTYSYPTSKNTLAEGLHTFYFEATDGYGYAWYDSDVDDASLGRLTRGAPDVYSDGCITPGGAACTLKVASALTSAGGAITFTVTGKNQDGIDGRTWTATFTSPGDYATGTEKTLVPTISGDVIEDVTGISASAWTGGAVYVKTPDPVKNASSSTPPSPIKPINGPSVHSNHAPTLTSGSVTPAQGYDLDSYIYSVTYTDNPDNDEPEYVEVYIDGSAPSNAYKMVAVGPSPDYTQGVQYRFTKQGLAAGLHSYFFKASDWLAEVTSPTVNNSPVVQARLPANITLSIPSSVEIGEQISADGYIRGYGSAPLSVDLNLALTKPGSIVTNVTVHSGADGHFQYAWTPLVTGTWTVQASWPGNSQYQTSLSPIRSFNATGPSTTVNGLDMISVPLTGISIFPDGVFGADPPFALAKWLPLKKDYKLYSLLPGIRTDFDFPAVACGQAYWIKTLGPKVIAPAGTLVPDTEDFNVSLLTGWNQFGSPFNREIEWGSLRIGYTSGGVTHNVTLAEAGANGWIKDYGWIYDKVSGNYQLVRTTGDNHTLIPWKGYWIKTSVNCTLIIPCGRSISAGNLAVSSVDSELPSPNVPKWQVKLTARNGQLRDECNYFGASRSGSERIESPGCFESFVDLYFTGDKGGVYASDLRGNLSHGDSWQFNVDTDRTGEIVLEWDGVQSVPSGDRLVLVDLAGNKSMTIAPGGSYRFEADPSGVSRSFRIDYLSK